MLLVKLSKVIRKSLFAFILPIPAFAFEIHIVDQNDKPVKNAVVAVPNGEISQVNSDPAVMDQIDRMFVPRVLAVEKGRDIVFPNSDNIRHHVYSFSEPKRFEIKLYKGVPRMPLTFEDEGLVVLGCNIHDSMIGYIFVSPWPDFTVTTDSGTVNFEGESTKVAVWHPWVKGLTQPMYVELNDAQSDGSYKVSLDLTPPKPVRKFKNKFRKYYDDER